MPLTNAEIDSYQDAIAPAGTILPVGETSFGPFQMRTFVGILLEVTRSDDGTNGTLAVVLKFNDHALGAQTSMLDGAGAAVAMNDFAAGENVRRQLQVHPTAGPIPSSDADGVFTVGTTGVASSYYLQPMPSDFYIVMTAAADVSTIAATLIFLN